MHQIFMEWNGGWLLKKASLLLVPMTTSRRIDFTGSGSSWLTQIARLYWPASATEVVHFHQHEHIPCPGDRQQCGPSTWSRSYCCREYVHHRFHETGFRRPPVESEVSILTRVVAERFESTYVFMSARLQSLWKAPYWCWISSDVISNAKDYTVRVKD